MMKLKIPNVLENKIFKCENRRKISTKKLIKLQHLRKPIEPIISETKSRD